MTKENVNGKRRKQKSAKQTKTMEQKQKRPTEMRMMANKSERVRAGGSDRLIWNGLKTGGGEQEKGRMEIITCTQTVELIFCFKYPHSFKAVFTLKLKATQLWFSLPFPSPHFQQDYLACLCYPSLQKQSFTKSMCFPCFKLTLLRTSNSFLSSFSFSLFVSFIFHVMVAFHRMTFG